MRNGYVFIVSTIADAATDDVVQKLTNLGVPHKRLNTEQYPFSSTLTVDPAKNFQDGWIVLSGEEMPTPSSIWYRRLRTPSKPQGMDEGVYTFCLQENRAALMGGILGFAGRWMSHPAAVWQAEYKPFQLSVAAQVGLQIPRTVVTNDPIVIRRAFTEFQEMIVKPARSGYLTHNGQEFAIFTSRVLQEHLDELESTAWSPAKATIRRLIDSAIQAPSAVNEQAWSFSVVRDKTVLARISEQAKAHMVKTPPTGLPSHHFHDLSDPTFDIFYHAPVLIVISSVTNSQWAVENCALAAENLMLSACAAGLGTCWIGFAQTWLGTPEGKATLELPPSYVPVAPIIVGHPKSALQPVPRKEPEIRWIGT